MTDKILYVYVKLTMLLAVSYVCALLPMVVGSLIFLTWYLTRKEIFMWLGIYTIQVGMFLVGFGFLILAWYSRQIKRTHRVLCWWEKTGVVIILLLSNFYLAAGYVYLAVLVESRIKIIIHNRTERPLDTITLFDSKSEHQLYLIDPKERIIVYFYPRGEGAINVKVESGGEVKEALISPYMTSDGKDDSEVIVNQGLKIEVVRLLDGKTIIEPPMIGR